MTLGVLEVLSPPPFLQSPSPQALGPELWALIHRLKITPTVSSPSTGMVFVLAFVVTVALPTSTACDTVRGL